LENVGESSSSSSSKIHPSVEKLFLSRLRKTGVALTASQLVDLAKERRLPAPGLAEAYRFIREDVPELAGYSGGRTKPKRAQYQTIGVSKPGVFFVDYAEFHKAWSGSNGGCTGFLLAVENLTNRLFASGTRGKDTNQWANSIAKFLENTRDVNLVYSDRDSVAKSERFRQRLQNRYGIRWHFLAKDNKSYLAESLIGFVKRKLGQGLRVKEAREGRKVKKWLDLLQPICDAYNHQKVPGTSYRRGAIHRRNFNDFAGQLFGEKDVTVSRYNSFKAGPFEHDSWNRDIFKFERGDKVLVLRSAIWKKAAREESEGGVFAKRSSEGSFSSRPFTIAGRQLRAVRNYKSLVPVYSLKEIGERHLHYYEPQLRKVGQWARESKAKKSN